MLSWLLNSDLKKDTYFDLLSSCAWCYTSFLKTGIYALNIKHLVMHYFVHFLGNFIFWNYWGKLELDVYLSSGSKFGSALIRETLLKQNCLL